MVSHRDSIEVLRLEVCQLREKIELERDSLPTELGFPKLLTEIEQALIPEELSKEKLERCSYGIFRLVTESYSFEQSNLGKQLLELRTKIRNVARELP